MAGGVVRGLRTGLRRRVGVWVLFEWRNKVVLGPRAVPLRRFESAEVRRLRGSVGQPRARVAVVMPTFRRPDLLPAAVASVLAQTVDDLVLIVVDDGGGVDRSSLPEDPRLHVVSLSRNTKVLGLVRNVGIRLTDSTYLAFLDDDNQWVPDHLEHAVERVDAGVDLVYTAIRRLRPDGTELDVLSYPFDRDDLAGKLTSKAFVDANSIVLRRRPGALFSRLPRVRSTLPKEDWEFVHRMSRRMSVAHLPVATVQYFVNPDSYYTLWAARD